MGDRRHVAAGRRDRCGGAGSDHGADRLPRGRADPCAEPGLAARDRQRRGGPRFTFYWRYRHGVAGVLPTGLILSLITVAILGFTGWLGGEMVFRHRVAVYDE